MKVLIEGASIGFTANEIGIGSDLIAQFSRGLYFEPRCPYGKGLTADQQWIRPAISENRVFFFVC